MMTSRGLTAFTIRLFDDKADDEAFELLFERAALEAPAIVLLEDIDRSFPRTGPSKTKISLQQLLNSLDGIATGEGIITLATANEPTALETPLFFAGQVALIGLLSCRSNAGASPSVLRADASSLCRPEP